MRIANKDGRAVLIQDGKALDIHTASDGAFGPDTLAVLEDWENFRSWAAGADASAGAEVADADLGTPVERPRQIFAIGLNYKDHARESNLDFPENIVVFTKFASSLTGPDADIALSSDRVDYEAELVAVIGREAHKVSVDDALDAVAGYAVGQDFSDRAVQLRPPAPQFSLGKSFPGYAQVGPAIVTLDEVADPNALDITCTFTGPTAQAQGSERWVAQDGNTRDMIFSVAQIVSDLSQVVTLYPGDLIFTGTPAGVGMARENAMIKPGDTVTTEISGLGSLVARFS